MQSKIDPPCVAFVFFSHQSCHENYTLTTLHSLLFQLIINNKALRPVLLDAYENNYRKLTSSSGFVEDLLENILKESPTTYFVVDGVDEVAEMERVLLLKSLMNLQKFQNLKLLISSRAEYDITLYLGSQCGRLQVHESNSQDIAHYVDHRTNSWLSGLDIDLELASELRRLTKKIGPNSEGELNVVRIILTLLLANDSEGMFLYAKLVCDALGRLSDLDDIKDEVTPS